MKINQRIVIKLGTSVLTAGEDRLNRPHMVEIMRQLAVLRQQGQSVVLVSSGAVLAGWEQLGFPSRKRTVAEKQLLAAIGQSRLMHLYGQLAEWYGLSVAQCLLTRDDFRHRTRYLNARNTLLECLSRGVLPIVNENDVVATDEIKLGDNDNLSAHVAALIDADLLIIATDCDGLYTADPRQNPEAQLVAEVAEVTPAIYAQAGGTGSHRGTGGMLTKIQAADLATRAGVDVRIVPGHQPGVLLAAAQNEPIGTLFHASTVKLEARKRWILADTLQDSCLTVDAGATQALLTQGKSLLPAGITAVSGEFERGQTVRIFATDGREIGRGSTQYDVADLRQIKGHRSTDIQGLLGYTHGDEVIHRDDLVLLG